MNLNFSLLLGQFCIIEINQKDSDNKMKLARDAVENTMVSRRKEENLRSHNPWQMSF